MPIKHKLTVRRLAIALLLAIFIAAPANRAPAREPEPEPEPSFPSVQLTVEGRMPSLSGATAWLNSTPIESADLRGKVVLVDFWTYTCINWLRTLPYVRAWYEKYKDQGLVVIGVHSPEFSFEKDVDNIRRAVQSRGIGFPIAVDSEHAIWNAFGNEFWPALYFIDARGNLRHSQFGEGHYDQAEHIIQQLLVETRAAPMHYGLVSVAPTGGEVAADWQNLRSPENYLGSDRTRNFASPVFSWGGLRHAVDTSSRLSLNSWALAGNWTVHRESVSLNESRGRILYRFHARDVNVVMGPTEKGKVVSFRVYIDGKPPGEAHGTDVDELGNGTVNEQRLYQLVRQPALIEDHLVEMEFLDAGLEAFAFTFG